ncbi:MAG: DUF2270 domain-containing protein [Planctomycetota bacterium]
MSIPRPDAEQGGAESMALPNFEQGPLTRMEYINAMVHFHRGEMQRATAWRLRLDTTTNWAIISTGGLVSFSFGYPDVNQFIIVLGQALLFFFLWLESRRYRYFDVWRSRVRKIEENFFSPILSGRLVSPDPLWGSTVASDLANPQFKMSAWHALHQRFRSNYSVLFLLTSVAWILKIQMHPHPLRTFGDLEQRLAIGALPWWATPILVVAGYLFLAVLFVVPGRATTAHGEHWGLGESDVEER